MKIWRNVIGLSVIALVFALLFACNPSGESSEPDDAVDSQSQATQETAAVVEESDDAAGTESEEKEAPDDDLKDLPEPATDVPAIETERESPQDGMVMVYVPEGEFEMGTSDEQRDHWIEKYGWDPDWNYNEQPIHTVYLDAFWIDRTEVTNGQYALCVAEGACQEPSSSESAKRTSYYGNPEFQDFPVVYVDWYMAKAYCAWAGRRLPTEAEWEKAARGTDGRTYPWGEGIDSTLANYGGTDCKDCDTTAVGSYLTGASPYGALDMAGNVWEWVADEYDNRYYLNSPSENPPGPSFDGTMRVYRGGPWNGTTNTTRSATRYRRRADYTDRPSGGIRCAASP